jgi:hypothetical protein
LAALMPTRPVATTLTDPLQFPTAPIFSLAQLAACQVVNGWTVQLMNEKLSLSPLLEWHRWFAWYPVPVMRKGRLRYAWLRFVERKWGTARYSGTMKWRYRLLTRSRMR